MFDLSPILENIPWDQVSDVLKKGAIAVSAAVVAIWAGDKLSRRITGKSMFEHIRNFSAGIEDRLRQWMRRKEFATDAIKKIVFVFELANTILTKAQNIGDTIEKAFVKVSIFGQTSSGRKVNTGEEVVMSVSKSEAEELTGKHEMIATLSELGF